IFTASELMLKLLPPNITYLKLGDCTQLGFRAHWLNHLTKLRELVLMNGVPVGKNAFQKFRVPIRKLQLLRQDDWSKMKFRDAWAYQLEELVLAYESNDSTIEKPADETLNLPDLP